MTPLRARRCETCAWWCQAMPAIAAATRDAAARPDLGTCQVMPPITLRLGMDVAAWPTTHASRFCGQWKPRGEGGDPDGGETMPHGAIIQFERKAA
jgi:hypothetical protein